MSTRSRKKDLNKWARELLSPAACEELKKEVKEPIPDQVHAQLYLLWMEWHIYHSGRIGWSQFIIDLMLILQPVHDSLAGNETADRELREARPTITPDEHEARYRPIMHRWLIAYKTKRDLIDEYVARR